MNARDLVKLLGIVRPVEDAIHAQITAEEERKEALREKGIWLP